MMASVRIGLPQLAGWSILAAVGWAAYTVHGRVETMALPGVDQQAVQAYQLGADYGNDLHDGCRLTPQLLAAIATVESHHGTIDGSKLVDYVAVPPIRGPRLDGDGFARILDTDGGALDGDTEYDRAVGPFEIIPTTWDAYRPKPDANPQDIRDGAMAAADLLCSVASKEGRGLDDPAVEEAAIRSYNDSTVYVDAVRGFERDYQAIAPGGVNGTGTLDAKAIATKLGQAGRDRQAALVRVADNTPGRYLDGALDFVTPLGDAVWNTLDRSSPGRAAELTASASASKIVAAAEAWVGRDFRPGVIEQCAYWVRQTLDDADVTLNPEVTLQTLDQWSSGGPGVANSFGGDQGLVVDRIEDLRPGDIIMFANTYGNWEAGSITHVGIVVEVNGDTADRIIMVDRPTAAAPVARRSIDLFTFAGAVRI